MRIFSLSPPFLLLLLLFFLLPSSLSLPPQITTIYPNIGPRTARTPVTIRGENLGNSVDDIIELLVGGTSCLETLMFDSSNSIGCIADRQRTKDLEGSNETDVGVIGPVSITTLSGGKSNQDRNYLFYNSCFMLSTSSDCINAGRYGQCKWCHHATRCVQMEEDCHEGCSSESFKMTCAELAGIVVASFFLLVLLVSSTAFFVVTNLPREKALSIQGSTKDGVHTDVASRWSKNSRATVPQEKLGNQTAGEDEDEEEEEEEEAPLLSEKFIRHQIAIENTHKKLMGNKSSLTSFY